MNDERNKRISEVFFGVVIAALLWALGVSVAFAQETPREWRNKVGDYVRLLDAPCSEPYVLKWIKKDWHDKYRNMEVLVNGQKVLGCWLQEEGDQNIYIVYEDGSNGPIPGKFFRRGLGV